MIRLEVEAKDKFEMVDVKGAHREVVGGKFKKQFMKNQGLKRWSQKRFEKVFIRELEEYMQGKTMEEMRSSLNEFAQRYSDESE